MPTLIWSGPDGEIVEQRPDVPGEFFSLSVPRSLSTGECFKLTRVIGLPAPAVTNLMREFG